MTTKPRTDGLYCTVESKTLNTEGEESMPYWSYLRFYPNGRVISTSTTGTPFQIAGWFAQEEVNETYIPIGEFPADQGTFNFTLQAATQNIDRDEHEYETRVDYTVAVEDEEATLLRVRWYSHINGNSGVELYRFAGLEEGS